MTISAGRGCYRAYTPAYGGGSLERIAVACTRSTPFEVRDERAPPPLTQLSVDQLVEAIAKEREQKT